MTTSASGISSDALTKTFTLKSNELGGQFTNQQYLNGMGFAGENQSPQLYWENAPKETQSFAVTIYDLDAPTGSGFWHWVVSNIPSNVNELQSDAGNPAKHLLPEGAIQSNTDMGAPGYVGAAPPEGPAHRYIITIYALKAPVQLSENTTAALAGFMLNMNTIAKASLLVYAQR